MMRNLGLDLLRLVAVLLVLGRHLDLPQSCNPFLQTWQRGGWVGVDLFFVLSGFLVSGLLYKEYLQSGRLKIVRFLVRRGLKIYPAFYVLLLVTLILCYRNGRVINWEYYASEALFLQNYYLSIWGHTWSLAVEEHFYIGIAILCAVLVLRRGECFNSCTGPFASVPLIFLVVAVSCLLLRLGNLLMGVAFSEKNFLFGTHIRVDSLMFGVLLSYFWHFKNLENLLKGISGFWLFIIGVILLSPAFVWPVMAYKWVSVLGVVLFYLGSGAWVLLAVRLKNSGFIFLNFCGVLGSASYSIYLWHMPVAVWGWPLLKKAIFLEPMPLWLYVLAYVCGSCAVGYVMSRIVEWPILKIRDTLLPRG